MSYINKRKGVCVSLERRMKKIISLVLIIVMLFSMVVPVMAETPINLTDIPNNWAKKAILAAVSNGLLVGSKNKVEPAAKLKRSEMAAIINRAFGAAQKGDISKFADIKPGKWYVDEMAKAVQMGTFSGENNKMRPDDFITRQEAFVVLARAFKLTSNDIKSLDKFKDNSNINEWAKPEISALAAAGYINGNKGFLNPNSNISRAEFAQVMYNILKSYIKSAGTVTSVPEGNVMINVPDVTLKGVTIKGDLIIGDGVGTGNVTLDAVKVEGRTVVRGGGKNSIHVINGSTITGTVIVDNVNNEVRIVTDQGTTVQKIETGSQVVLEGSFGEVKVVGDNNSNSSIEVKGNIQTLSVETKADVKVTSGTVSKVQVIKEATGTTINTVQGAKIETVTANAQVNITGTGTVTNVQANANDVKVDTAGTKVSAAQGVTNVTAGGKTVDGGTTVTNNSTITNPSTPSGGGTPSSSNANLSGITLSTGTLQPEFNSNMTQYYVRVPSAANSLTITPAKADTNASVTVNGTAASTPVSLSTGLNSIAILVTAQNGSTKTYQLKAIRADVVSTNPVSVSDNSTLGTAGLFNNAYSFNTAGTYGPASGIATVAGNVYIDNTSITLQNMIVLGKLTFGSSIGTGDAVINDVTVLGNTIVNGGGSNSIHIQGDSTLGVIAVDDKRTDKSTPINISAEGTGSIEAVNVTSQTPVKVTPLTNTIGYVAATDNSTLTYGGSEDNKVALFNKILDKANSILDAAIIGTTDANKLINPDLPSLTAGIVDSERYGIWSLKYYINPLDGVSAYQTQFNALQDKLVAKGLDTDLINLRDHQENFTTTMYDQDSPMLGFNQGAVDGWWNTFTRFLAYKKYQIDSNGTVSPSTGNTDDSTTQTAFISTAETLYDRLDDIQNSSVVNSSIIIDADSNGLDAGDRIEFTFKRRLEPNNSNSGQVAVSDLVYSDTTRFGSNANVIWSTTPLSFYGSPFQVSKCTITLGTGSHTGLLGGTFTIPKEKLGSYIPNDFTEIHGQYGAYVTNSQPLFDINISIPSGVTVPYTPVFNTGSVIFRDNGSGNTGSIGKGDMIEFAFTGKLSQSSIDEIDSWVNENPIFGTGTEPGAKCLANIPDPSVTRLGIQLGNGPTITHGGTFTIDQTKIYDATGLTISSDLTITIP